MNDEHVRLRAVWKELVGRRLPEAARTRPDWPIRLDHCFGRVILDTVHDRPWREVIPPPAWRSMTPEALAAAIALGEAILAGEVDLHALDARSLELRGKPQKVRQTASTGPRSSGTLRPA
jgi:hypothetical protein